MEYPNVTQDKLIILHIISKLNKNITNLQVVDLILETTGIDYFSLQELLLNLEEQKLIFIINHNDCKYYKITDDGKVMLSSLINLVPDFLLTRIDSEIHNIKKKIDQKEVVFADYSPIDENNFAVVCKISENDITLVELTLNVPLKSQAIDICNKWYENPSKYYTKIINAFSDQQEASDVPGKE